MGRIGCGYETLGGLIRVEPAEIKRLARQRFGILRPIGLYAGELADLARHYGFRMMGGIRPARRVTCARLVAEARRGARRNRQPRSLIIRTRGHLQGAYIGADGSVSRIGYFRASAIVLEWWDLQEIPKP